MGRWAFLVMLFGVLSAGACARGVNSNMCIGDPCGQSGYCELTEAVSAGYICVCDPGFGGDRCEENIDDCIGHQCENGGTCVDGVEAYTCKCPAGFKGEHCEVGIAECVDGLCLNGGECVDEVDGYTCMCPEGFAGEHCEDSVNLCDDNPCKNGGSCVGGGDSFECECPDDFGGDLCELHSVTFNVDTNLSVDSSGNHSCADGGDAVAYSVVWLTAIQAELSAAPAAGCIVPGDEVMLINLQGAGDYNVNVGNYEVLTVSGVIGSVVTFVSNKVRFYGDNASDDSNIGLFPTQQRVMLQRIPKYNNVTIASGVTVTAAPWNGLIGGVLPMYAAGQVDVEGVLQMDGAGYRGAAQTTVTNTNGTQGESVGGLGAMGPMANVGGGGGGIGDNHGCATFGSSAGGGAHGTAGGSGLNGGCSGVGGGAYGDPALMKMFFGSAGGSGGSDDVLFDNPPGGYGGSGGGIIWIQANKISITTMGEVTANGLDGEGDLPNVECSSASIVECWDFSGPGGGGAGGSVRLIGEVLNGMPSASGGLGGNGYDATTTDGGDGGEGIVFVGPYATPR